MNINKFDFTAANEALSGMKVGFKNNKEREQQFKKLLLKEHKKFFNKTLSDRRAVLIKTGAYNNKDAEVTTS